MFPGQADGNPRGSQDRARLLQDPFPSRNMLASSGSSWLFPLSSAAEITTVAVCPAPRISRYFGGQRVAFWLAGFANVAHVKHGLESSSCKTGAQAFASSALYVRRCVRDCVFVAACAASQQAVLVAWSFVVALDFCGPDRRGRFSMLSQIRRKHRSVSNSVRASGHGVKRAFYVGSRRRLQTGSTMGDASVSGCLQELGCPVSPIGAPLTRPAIFDERASGGMICLDPAIFGQVYQGAHPHRELADVTGSIVTEGKLAACAAAVLVQRVEEGSTCRTIRKTHVPILKAHDKVLNKLALSLGFQTDFTSSL